VNSSYAFLLRAIHKGTLSRIIPSPQLKSCNRKNSVNKVCTLIWSRVRDTGSISVSFFRGCVPLTYFGHRCDPHDGQKTLFEYSSLEKTLLHFLHSYSGPDIISMSPKTYYRHYFHLKLTNFRLLALPHVSRHEGDLQLPHICEPLPSLALFVVN